MVNTASLSVRISHCFSFHLPPHFSTSPAGHHGHDETVLLHLLCIVLHCIPGDFELAYFDFLLYFLLLHGWRAWVIQLSTLFFLLPQSGLWIFPGIVLLCVYIIPLFHVCFFFSSNFMLLWSEQAYRLQMNERIFDST